MGGLKIKTPSEDELNDAKDKYEKWLISNPNNFHIWFSALRDITSERVRIPKSTIVAVPKEVRRAFFMENETDSETVKKFVSETLLPKVKDFSSGNKRVFIKNGCYSGKFDFRNSCLLEDFTQESVIKHVMNIEQDSLIFDIGGDCEFVIREYLEPKPDTPEIYNGMPFRPEMRLFYDFDKKQVLYKVFYWDWDYCRNIICERNEEDGKVFDANYKQVFSEYERLSDKHMDAITEALSKIKGLSRIWSVDFILEENSVWLIDMAIGPESAYWKKEFETE